MDYIYNFVYVSLNIIILLDAPIRILSTHRFSHHACYNYIMEV